MIAEIWVGNRTMPTYKISNVKMIDASMDGSYCRIIDEYGYTYETSPHNVVLITLPSEKDPN